MIIEGVEYPESIMTQLIGEQALTIDHLRFRLRQSEESNRAIVKENASLSETLTELRARLSDIADKNNG